MFSTSFRTFAKQIYVYIHKQNIMRSTLIDICLSQEWNVTIIELLCNNHSNIATDMNFSLKVNINITFMSHYKSERISMPIVSILQEI